MPQEQQVKALQLSMIQKPSRCKEICDEAQQQGLLQDRSDQLPHRPSNPVGALSRHYRSPFSCTCISIRPRRSQHSISKNVSALWATKSSHNPGCPLSGLATRTDTAQLSFRFCNAFLSRTIQATMSLTRGAGGFSISPGLNFRNIVRYDSPASRLIYNEMLSWMSLAPDDINQRSVIALNKLRRLFEEGKASPTDQTQYGWNLLHVKDLADIFHLIKSRLMLAVESHTAFCFIRGQRAQSS